MAGPLQDPNCDWPHKEAATRGELKDAWNTEGLPCLQPRERPTRESRPEDRQALKEGCWGVGKASWGVNPAHAGRRPDSPPPLLHCPMEAPYGVGTPQDRHGGLMPPLKACQRAQPFLTEESSWVGGTGRKAHPQLEGGREGRGTPPWHAPNPVAPHLPPPQESTWPGWGGWGGGVTLLSSKIQPSTLQDCCCPQRR
ncbi:UNVERIFIED_CONTAM: hypothetical protein K2H54_006609 [Gekko kuhli]